MHMHAIAQVKIKGHKTKSHEVGGGLLGGKGRARGTGRVRGWGGEYDKNMCMYVIAKE